MVAARGNGHSSKHAFTCWNVVYTVYSNPGIPPKKKLPATRAGQPSKHISDERRGCWLRESLKARGMTVCIPPRKTRNTAFPFDKTLYKRRHLIENTFSKLKDWRRIATRYDRCAHTFFSAICLAVSVIFYLH